MVVWITATRRTVRKMFGKEARGDRVLAPQRVARMLVKEDRAA